LLQLGANLSIIGQSNGTSIINGFDGITNYVGIVGDSVIAPGSFPNLTITDVNLSNIYYTSIFSRHINTTVERVRITNCVNNTGSAFGIMLSSQSSGSINASPVNNVIRDVEVSNCNALAETAAVYQSLEGQSNYNTLIENLTVHQIQTSGASAIGVANISSGSPGTNTIGIITIRNSTFNNTLSNRAIAVLNKAFATDGSTTTSNIAIQNSTIVGNNFLVNAGLPTAGGIFNQGYEDSPADTANATVTVQNTIIANNQAHNGTSVVSPMNCTNNQQGSNGAIAITSLGNNLSDDNTCGTATTGDQYNTPTSSITSFLGTLQNNGGFTPTMALLTGSPAINAGATLASVTTDQRGISRPQSTAYDIGAFELEISSPPPPPPNPNNNSGNNTNTSNTEYDTGRLADTGISQHIVFVTALMLIFAGSVAFLNRKYLC
jgi:hypothetical protein